MRPVASWSAVSFAWPLLPARVVKRFYGIERSSDQVSFGLCCVDGGLFVRVFPNDAAYIGAKRVGRHGAFPSPIAQGFNYGFPFHQDGNLVMLISSK
jgi:hypothetical protein